MGDQWKTWAASALINPSDKSKASDRVGIYGLDGNPWSQICELNIPPTEVQAIIKAMDGGGTININDVKYIVLRTEGDVLMAKAQNKGFTVAKGKSFILIGLYDDHNVIGPGNNCKRVCEVKDQLVAYGY